MRRSVWNASSPKTGLTWVWRGLVELSTMSHGSTTEQVCVPMARPFDASENHLVLPSSTCTCDLCALFPTCRWRSMPMVTSRCYPLPSASVALGRMRMGCRGMRQNADQGPVWRSLLLLDWQSTRTSSEEVRHELPIVHIPSHTSIDVDHSGLEVLNLIWGAVLLLSVFNLWVILRSQVIHAFLLIYCFADSHIREASNSG
jgi:hypothetical protein